MVDPEGGRGATAPSEIGQNLVKLVPFLPILASAPTTDHPESAPDRFTHLKHLSRMECSQNDDFRKRQGG